MNNKDSAHNYPVNVEENFVIQYTLLKMIPKYLNQYYVYITHNYSK